MIRFIFTAVFLLFVALPAHAGFDDGLAAFKRGDFDKALSEWLPLARGGNANAQNNIGLMFHRGKGVAEDHVEAGNWYRKAAHQGHASAQYNIGLMYLRGDGVGNDNAEAERWLRRASEADHSGAQNNLGVMYRRGLGVDVDYGEALKWFRMAAEQSYARAEYNLAQMYSEGQGTRRDDVKAYVWLEFAAKNLPAKGRGSAQALRDTVAKRLSAEDFECAQRMAKEWSAKRAEWGESVTLIPWKASFSVGKEELDDQHRRLFGLINMLYRAWVYGDETTILGEIFDDLLSYTVYHFKREEELLAQNGYQHLGAHKREHAKLQEQVLAFRERYLSGSETNQLISEVSEFLRSWMSNHILGSDMLYKQIVG